MHTLSLLCSRDRSSWHYFDSSCYIGIESHVSSQLHAGRGDGPVVSTLGIARGPVSDNLFLYWLCGMGGH